MTFARGLLRELRTGRRVRADLANAFPSSLTIAACGISPNGRSMAGNEASLEVASRGESPARRLHRQNLLHQKSRQAMTNTEQDRWSRVKGRLRSSVGEDVYTSWFARMDLESVQPESVHLSVPTRFLKSWIQAHYAERVLTCWQAEMPEVHRIDLTVRTAMRCVAPAKEVAVPGDPRRTDRHDGRPAPELARHRDRAGVGQPRRPRRLAARPSPDLRKFRRSAAPTRWPMPRRARSRRDGAATA